MVFDLSVINGDLVLKNGDLATLTGSNKLIQDILKICLTDTGANLYAPWYGSGLSKSVIGTDLDTAIVLDIAKSQIQNSLDNLKKMQEIQIANGFQRIEPSELIAAVKEIAVTRNRVDPRIIEVSVKVLSKAFNVVEASFSISNFV